MSWSSCLWLWSAWLLLFCSVTVVVVEVPAILEYDELVEKIMLLSMLRLEEPPVVVLAPGSAPIPTWAPVSKPLSSRLPRLLSADPVVVVDV